MRMPELSDDQVLHQLKNHIAIIVGFTDLLLADVTGDERRAADLREVHTAARQAMAILPEVARRLGLKTLEDER
jgi:hypothetical protein